MNAPGLKITNPHYANMRMPDPDMSQAEYPKWVYMDGYPGQLAEDAEDEARLLARPCKEPAEKAVTFKPQVIPPIENAAQKIATAIKPLSGPNNERDLLMQVAKEKNIKVDGRWAINRLRATIERETKDA